MARKTELTLAGGLKFDPSPPAQSQRRTSPPAFGVDRAIPLSEGCSAYVQVARGEARARPLSVQSRDVRGRGHGRDAPRRSFAVLQGRSMATSSRYHNRPAAVGVLQLRGLVIASRAGGSRRRAELPSTTREEAPVAAARRHATMHHLVRASLPVKSPKSLLAAATRTAPPQASG